MRWSDAYDVKQRLIEVWRSPKGKLQGQVLVQSLIEEHYEIDQEERALCLAMPVMEPVALERAAPVAVSEDICDIVDAAHTHHTLEIEQLSASDFFTPAAFVLLPRTVTGGLRGFTWAPIVPIARTAQAEYAAAGVSTPVTFEEAFSGLTAEEIANRGMWLLPYLEASGLTSPVAPGSPIMMMFGDSPWPANTIEAMKREHPYLLWIWAFWRIAQQHISTVTSTRADRATRRRVARARQKEQEIQVVRLRRPAHPPSGEHHTVDWKNRWIVGAHWRNQWYESTKQHRLIWISAYQKGPEDKPLKASPEKAFEFVR